MALEHFSLPAEQAPSNQSPRPDLKLVPPHQPPQESRVTPKPLPSFSDPEKVKARSFIQKSPWLKSVLMALAMHGLGAAAMSQVEQGKDTTELKENKVNTYYKVGFHEDPEELRVEIQKIIAEHGIESIDLATFFMRTAYAMTDMPKEEIVAAEQAFDKQVEQMRKLFNQSGEPMDVLHELTQPVPMGLEKGAYERDQALLPRMILNASGNCEANDARNIAILQRLLAMGVLDKKNISVKTQVFSDHYQTVVKIGELLVKLTPPTPTVVSKQDLEGTVLIDATDHVRMFLGEAVDGTSFESRPKAPSSQGEKVGWGNSLQTNMDKEQSVEKVTGGDLLPEKKTRTDEPGVETPEPEDNKQKPANKKASSAEAAPFKGGGYGTNSIISVLLKEAPTKAFTDQPIPKQIDYKAAERISRTQAYLALADQDPSQFEKLATVSPKAMEILMDRLEKERASSREQAIFDVGMQIHEMGKLLTEKTPQSTEKAKQILQDIRTKGREWALMDFFAAQEEPLATFLKENQPDKKNTFLNEALEKARNLGIYQFDPSLVDEANKTVIDQLIKEQIPIYDIRELRSCDDLNSFNTSKLDSLVIHPTTKGALDHIAPDKVKSLTKLSIYRPLSHLERDFINKNMPLLNELTVRTDRKRTTLTEIKNRIQLIRYMSNNGEEFYQHWINQHGEEVKQPKTTVTNGIFVDIRYEDPSLPPAIKKMEYDPESGTFEFEFHQE